MIYKYSQIVCGGGRKGSGPRPKPPSPDTPKKLRKWQPEAYSELHGQEFCILRSPVSSGKTLLAKFLAIDYLGSNPAGKVIFSVPQDLIGPNYAVEHVSFFGETIDFTIPKQFNLCETKEGCLRTLTEFLGLRTSSLVDKVCICTHSAVRDLYESLKRDGRLSLLEGVLLVIDESHRLYIDSEKGEASVLGNAVRYCVTKPEAPRSRLLLMSGSLFRADDHSVIPSDLKDKFVIYELPYDRYVRDMDYLEEFHTQFLCGSKSYENAVHELMNEYQDSKWFVYIPGVNSHNQRVNKYEQARRIIRAIGEVVEDDGVTMLVKRNGKLLRGVNLVDEDNREEKKDWLHRRSGTELAINKDRNELDFIVSLQMVVEGFDWIWADQAVILGARNSLREVVQIIGRVLRDVPGKRVTRLTMVLPPLVGTEAEDLKNLNGYVRSVFVVMLGVGEFEPVRIEVKTSDKKGQNGTEHRTLSKIIGEELYVEVFEKAISLMATEHDRPGGSYEAYVDRMTEYLQDLKIEPAREVAKGLWRMAINPWAKANNLDISSFSELELVKADPLLGLRLCSKAYSAHAGRDVWTHIRSIACRIEGYLPVGQAMVHLRVLGVKEKSEYEVAARTELILGRPLSSRTELETVIREGKPKRDPEQVRTLTLPINPKRTYGSRWLGWPYFLGRGPKHPSSLVEKPRGNQKLHWVLKVVLWCHRPEDVVRSGTVGEISKDIDPVFCEALSDRNEAEAIGEERRAMVKGLEGVFAPPPNAQRSACRKGLMAGLLGVSWIPSKVLAGKHCLSEKTVLFMPQGNGIPMDGQTYPVKSTFLEEA